MQFLNVLSAGMMTKSVELVFPCFYRRVNNHELIPTHPTLKGKIEEIFNSYVTSKLCRNWVMAFVDDLPLHVMTIVLLFKFHQIRIARGTRGCELTQVRALTEASLTLFNILIMPMMTRKIRSRIGYGLVCLMTRKPATIDGPLFSKEKRFLWKLYNWNRTRISPDSQITWTTFFYTFGFPFVVP